MTHYDSNMSHIFSLSLSLGVLFFVIYLTPSLRHYFTETNNFPFDFYKYIKYDKLCLKIILSQYNQYNHKYYNNDHFKKNNKMLNNFLLKLIT